MASQVESIKWVPGADFLVDGFAFKSPRCSHYFLTHFHSDHTVGLNKGFDGGFIYCSHVTARLLVHDMGLRPQVVKPLAVGTAVVIAGVQVTPLDANHCPGAVMFLFEVPAAAATAATEKSRLPAVLSAVVPSSSGCLNGLPGAGPSARAPGGAAATPVPGIPGAVSHRGRASPVGLPSGPAQSRELASGGSDDQKEEEEAPEQLTALVAPSGKPSVPGDGTAAVAAAETHNILHTGDCRWQRWMRDQPGLAGVRVDTLLLDTTYAAPKHTLPPQQEAIELMVQVMREALAAEPQTVFVVAAYHIGKERAFLGAAQQLGTRVWCNAAKRSVLRLLDLPAELMALLVDDPRDAAVHVTGWGLRPEDLQAYLERHPGVWKQAVGIRPTGWTLRRSGGVSIRREGNVAVIGVPYSEHSSWTDLCDAVSQLRPRTLIPTVNAATPAQRRALVDRFAHLMDLSADRSRMDVYLARGAPANRAESQAGCEAAHGACERGDSDAAPAGPATPATVIRVDLAAVDLAEQERILAELQRDRQRQQEQQQRRKRRAPCADEEASTAADKRPRVSAPQLQPPIGRRRGAGAGIDCPGAGMALKAEGGCVGGHVSVSCQATAAGAENSVARGDAACSSRGGGSDVAAACVVDLTVSDGDEEDARGSGMMDARVGAGVCPREEQRGPGSGRGAQIPAREFWAADEWRGNEWRVGGVGGELGSQQTPRPTAAAPPVLSPGLQSSIRRFFVPIGRMAAAMLGGLEGGGCVEKA